MSLKTLLDLIAQLAPFSIVVAALGLLNSYRQAAQRRKDEKVQRTRELLSELRTTAYAMTWSFLGDAEVEMAILRVREEVRKRLGDTPTADAIRDLMADQRLREAIVYEAFDASGFNARVQETMREFARLRASATFSNPAIEAAMSTVEAQLRLWLMRATFVVVALRREGHPLHGHEGEPAHEKAPLAYLHQVLRGDAELPRKEGMSDACKLIEQLGDAVVHASDATVLKLYAKPGPLRKLLDWRARRRQTRRLALEETQLRGRIAARFPADAEALATAVHAILQKRSELEIARSRLAAARNRLAKIFGDTGEDAVALLKAADEFLATQLGEDEEDQRHLEKLLAFKAQGIDDPNIDMFLAVAAGMTSLLESALQRGGDPNLGILTLLRKHENPAPPKPQAKPQTPAF